MELSATQLARAYAAGDRSPVDVLEECLATVAARDPELNAFCLLDPEGAGEAAAASAARYAARRPLGPLDGVPVAVKDLVLTAGWPTRRGSRLVDPDQPWRDDAPAVERLRAGGAVLLGKTTTPEFGWKAVTDSPLTGVTRNPLDPTRTAGGSSGGSAAAVGAKMVPLALGTDGAGSIRIPASFCGTVGVKPTHGVVPAWPPSPFGPVAHLGPIANTVADARAMLEVLRGQHWRDPASAGQAPWPGEQSVTGLRVAYSPGFAGAAPTAAVEEATARSVRHLEQLGAVVHEVGTVVAPTAALIGGLFAAGAAQLLGGLDAARRGELDPGFLALALSGAGLSASDYLELQRERQEVAIALGALFLECDLVVTPTLPIVAFAAGRDVPEGWPTGDWTTWTPCTHPFNLSQQPALTLPCGSEGGLPVGVQLAAARFDDARLLGAAAALEQALSAA
ncbi:MAG TPA: amidase [Acidimicrobiales bacterium]|nr:amidase [Acidimicrobiales bacterium]